MRDGSFYRKCVIEMGHFDREMGHFDREMGGDELF